MAPGEAAARAGRSPQPPRGGTNPNQNSGRRMLACAPPDPSSRLGITPFGEQQPQAHPPEPRVPGREKQTGGSGGYLNPLGLFLRASIPFLWRILSACLPA